MNYGIYSLMSICFFTEVRCMAIGYVSTGMGDFLSSRPTMGCVRVEISLCHYTFINFSALLVSLMAVHLAHRNQKTFWPCLVWKSWLCMISSQN